MLHAYGEYVRSFRAQISGIYESSFDFGKLASWLDLTKDGFDSCCRQQNFWFAKDEVQRQVEVQTLVKTRSIQDSQFDDVSDLHAVCASHIDDVEHEVCLSLVNDDVGSQGFSRSEFDTFGNATVENEFADSLIRLQ